MSWQGLNKVSGRSVSESAHIAQSIQDILTTPLGSRVMRRDYGSAIFELIDQPQNQSVKLQIMAAAVIAITRLEPRVSISEISIDTIAMKGKMQLTLVTDRNDSSRPQVVEVVYG